MKAMILAAGRGERMRPLSDITPKPLLQAGQHRLIEWHLVNLAQAGFTEIVINVSYQADMIMTTLGRGARFGVHIDYSLEPETGGLETGGGIFRALPLLGKQPFVVISADIWSDYPLAHFQRTLNGDLAHLIMVDNPSFHPEGDFALHNGRVSLNTAQKYTYGNMAVLDPRLFNGWCAGKFPLAPLLRQAMADDRVSGEVYRGQWFNVGTPALLADLNRQLAADDS